MKKRKTEIMTKEELYVAPTELTERWRCGRSTVDRIAERERFTKLYLGCGKNGIVRFLWREVVTYEQSRLVKPH
jgi:hypothetical protein